MIPPNGRTPSEGEAPVPLGLYIHVPFCVARCSFCAFYRDRPFRILEPQAFEQHLIAVSRLFGRALGLRNGVFIGSANALVLSQRRLLAVLEQVSDTFGQLRRGAAAFWDPDHSPMRSVAEWKELSRAGLTRIYAGLETGDPALRRSLGKSDAVEWFTSSVREVRAGGVAVGVIVLAGVGGEAAAHRHGRATAEAIRDMALDEQDIVYVSPLEGSMPAVELAQEASLLRRAIAAQTEARVAPYRMDLFRYYA